MVDILPIEKIREEDAPLVGSAAVNLAKLSQNGIRVAEGVVITAPDFRLRTILKHFDLKDREVFEQSLEIIRGEIKKIEVPEELDKILSKRGIKSGKVWLSLLEIWINELRQRIWQSGLSSGVTLNLSAQPIFFIKKISAGGKTWIDQSGDVVIEAGSGQLNSEQRKEIEKIAPKGNKILFLPHVYHWIITEREIRVVRVVPFTPSPEEKRLMSVSSWEEEVPVKKTGKSSIKVFLDLSEGLVTRTELDGIYLQAEKIGSTENQIFKLVDSASTHPDKAVLYKLSDQIEQKGGVRGTLRLIHQDSLLKSDVNVLLFARNKKSLNNISVVVPYVRSVLEFLQIKRDLSALGVSRKGSLKLWLELCVPENIINLEEYVTSGLDGVVINLDELSSLIGGFDTEVPESSFYSKQVKALLKLLEDKLMMLHQSRIPFLASGNLALHDEVLSFLISKGVFGIVADLANAESLGEHLRFMEKRHVRAKLG